MTKRVTISDVAQAAGVSPTAVSFAFNNPSQLNAETVERITATALQLGYSPSPIARAMSAQKTGMIGVLAPSTLATSFANPFTAAFLQGVGSVCDTHGFSMLLVSPLDGSVEDAVRRAPVDGYIVLGLNEWHPEIEPLRRRRVPLVVVDGEATTASQVNVDDEGGAYQAASYLLKQGHRDILIVTFESPSAQHLDDLFYGVGGRRLEGYQRAYDEAGLPFRFDWLVQAATSIEGGAATFAAAWQQGLRPTAVLAVADAMAFGVIEQASQLGLRIANDLAVIGFDDVPLASLSSPALSTIHQPIIEKGQAAAELLVAVMSGTREAERLLLPTHLILRETTTLGAGYQPFAGVSVHLFCASAPFPTSQSHNQPPECSVCTHLQCKVSRYIRGGMLK